MKTHELKTIDPYFEMVWNGNKKFELRKNDRDFKKGDALVLKEYKPEGGIYTGRKVHCYISDVVYFPEGLKDGYVALCINCIFCESS